MKRLALVSLVILSCVPKGVPKLSFWGRPSGDGTKLVVSYRVENSEECGEIILRGDGTGILSSPVISDTTHTLEISGPYEIVDILYTDTKGNNDGGTVLRPMELYTFNLCLYDTCNNAVAFKDLEYVIFSGNSVPMGYKGFKLIKTNDTVMVVSLNGVSGWCKISSEVTSYIAPDVSQYYDTVKVSPSKTYALWFDDNGSIDINDFFGKVRITGITSDSISFNLAIQTMKGLRWIKGGF